MNETIQPQSQDKIQNQDFLNIDAEKLSQKTETTKAQTQKSDTYSRLLNTIQELEVFQNKEINPNLAANFLRTLPTITLKQFELKSINDDPSLLKEEKEEINNYYNHLQNTIKIIKLQLNFKPFFNIVSSDLTTTTAYLQEIKDRKGKVQQEPNLVLRKAYELKLEEF